MVELAQPRYELLPFLDAPTVVGNWVAWVEAEYLETAT